MTTQIDPGQVQEILWPVRERWAQNGFEDDWNYVVEENQHGIPVIYTTVYSGADGTVEQLLALEREIERVLRAHPSTAAYFPMVHFGTTEPVVD